LLRHHWRENVSVKGLAANLNEKEPLAYRCNADVAGLGFLVRVKDDQIVSQNAGLGEVLSHSQSKMTVEPGDIW